MTHDTNREIHYTEKKNMQFTSSVFKVIDAAAETEHKSAVKIHI